VNLFLYNLRIETGEGHLLFVNNVMPINLWRLLKIVLYDVKDFFHPLAPGLWLLSRKDIFLSGTIAFLLRINLHAIVGGYFFAIEPHSTKLNYICMHVPVVIDQLLAGARHYDR
jgi:hypothetical protein